MQVETRQDEPSGWCFRRDVDSSFSLMIPFLAWETLNYELKPSILFSKTTLFAAKFVPCHDVCACLSNFLPFFVCAFLSLLMSFEMIELDASHWTHDETLYGLDAPGDDAEGDRHWRNYQDRSPFPPNATAAAEEWCFFIQSSRNQKTDKWCLSLNHVESCFRMLRSTSLAYSELDDACICFMQVKRYHLNPFITALVWTAKWRNWCRTNLGLETAPIKSFISKTRFVSLGSYCALPSIAGKLQIEVIEVTLHGARELPIFIWPVVASNGVIVLCMVVFCLELFMPRALIPGV